MDCVGKGQRGAGRGCGARGGRGVVQGAGCGRGWVGYECGETAGLGWAEGWYGLARLECLLGSFAKAGWTRALILIVQVAL